MFFLSDLQIVEFEGKKNRSGRKKGSKNRVRPLNRSEVVYKTESSPIQNLRDISIAYRNIVSPSASLLKAGTGTGRLIHQINMDKIKLESIPKRGFWSKASGFYDSGLNKVKNTASTGKVIQGIIPPPQIEKNEGITHKVIEKVMTNSKGKETKQRIEILQKLK